MSPLAIMSSYACMVFADAFQVSADAFRVLPEASLYSAYYSAALVELVVVFLVAHLLLLRRRNALKDFFPLQAVVKPLLREKATLTQLTAKSEDDLSPPWKDIDRSSRAPGLALLEQYCVFGVPSGSWIG